MRIVYVNIGIFFFWFLIDNQILAQNFSEIRFEAVKIKLLPKTNFFEVLPSFPWMYEFPVKIGDSKSPTMVIVFVPFGCNFKQILVNQASDHYFLARIKILDKDLVNYLYLKLSHNLEIADWFNFIELIDQEKAKLSGLTDLGENKIQKERIKELEKNYQLKKKENKILLKQFLVFLKGEQIKKTIYLDDLAKPVKSF